MKGNIPIVKAHKWFGRIEATLFFAITVQCLIMFVNAFPFASKYLLSLDYGSGIHSIIGGFIALLLFCIKFFFATFKKDIIYKYGKYIGPIGVIAWNLGHWTSLVNFYYNVLPRGYQTDLIVVPHTFFWAAFTPFPIGLAIFFGIYAYTGQMNRQKRFSLHQIAFVMHGITFGYEGATRELLGTPALFKYVVPKTYEFLEKMMGLLGFDLKKLETLTVKEGMDEFMKRAASIGMAEKIKIVWDSDKNLSVESINCSTAQVRSVMKKEELKNAVCPWAIMAASIINKISGKEVEFDPSEFNEIGAKTTLRIK